ncbi:hypothetical protein [Desulfurobacterium sp.]
MQMKVWMCKKCGALIEKPTQPNATRCPSGGTHFWYTLGDGYITPHSGYTAWQCGKCGAVVYMKRMPNGGGCPAGGNHHWRRL